MNIIKKICVKNLTPRFRLSRPLKIIGTDTDRSATYDFLLTFHNNHGSMSYRFRDKWRFQSEKCTFYHPRVFKALAEGIRLWIGYRRLASKTKMMGLPAWERRLAIPSAVWIQYTNVTDRQTDRPMDTGRQQRPRLRIASRDNKYMDFWFCSCTGTVDGCLSCCHAPTTHIDDRLTVGLKWRSLSEIPARSPLSHGCSLENAINISTATETAPVKLFAKRLRLLWFIIQTVPAPYIRHTVRVCAACWIESLKVFVG